MNLFKRIALLIAIFFGLLMVLVITILIQSVSPEQNQPEIKTHVFADTLANREYDLDSLIAIIGNNKGLPEGFETAAAIAYSAYPELKEVAIDMLLTEQGAPMETTPEIASLIGPRSNRKYLILLNDNEESFFEPILLRSLPFDAQIGILAHELGHVVYYHKLNLLQFGKWGLKYLNDPKFMAIHEKSTDLMPVYHGLGSQIYQYAYFVRNDPACKSFYEMEKDFMDTYYLTDKELAEVMAK